MSNGMDWHCRDGQGYKCDRPATHWLTAPDGKYRMRMCEIHARDCASEYAEKLGWHWTVEAAEVSE